MSRLYDALRKIEEQGTELTTKPTRSSLVASEAPDTLQSVPVLHAHLNPESRVVVSADESCPGAERFRLLRMGLRNLQARKNMKTVLITSALPNDGKSTMALNVGTSLAEGGKAKVLICEADFRRPSLARVLGLEPWEGLTESLEDGHDPAAAMRRIEPLGIYLLPAGKPVQNPIELFQKERFASLLRECRSRFDWILVDSPPAFPLADTMALKALVDGTLLVVRADNTPRESVLEALGLFEPGQVIGLILNAAADVDKLYSDYYRYKP